MGIPLRRQEGRKSAVSHFTYPWTAPFLFFPCSFGTNLPYSPRLPAKNRRPSQQRWGVNSLAPHVTHMPVVLERSPGTPSLPLGLALPAGVTPGLPLYHR